MSPLQDALAKFEYQLSRLTPFAASHLAPGLPRDEVKRLLETAGIDAPEDILEWFAWQNGSDNAGDSPRSSIPIGPVYWVTDLSSLIEEYLWRIDFISQNTPHNIHAEIGWFPIIGTNHGDMVVADCRGPKDKPVQCTTLGSDEFMSYRTALHTLSLVELVELWAGAMADGTWVAQVDEDWPVWLSNTTNYESLPIELRLTGLAP